MWESILDKVVFDQVSKDLSKVPEYIRFKLLFWAMSVEYEGIHEVRKLKTYRDEALKGKRKGQRSIRLSRSYRAIYIEQNDGTINLIIIKEVNKYEY